MIRSAARFIAVGCICWSVVVVLSTLLAPGQTARLGTAIAVPAFLAMFVPGLVVVSEQRRITLKHLSLHGWRLAAVVGLGVWILVLIASALTAPSLKGDPVERNGSYYVEDLGAYSEISRDDYLGARNNTTRLFAGIPVLFAGIAALLLTTPTPIEARPERPTWWPHPAARRQQGRWHRARGFQTVDAEVPGTLEEVLARLRRTIPITATVAGSVTTATIDATWAVPQARSRIEVYGGGALSQTLHGTTTVELELGLVSRIASWVLLPLLFGLPFIVGGLAIASVAVIDGAEIGAIIFMVIWASFAGAITAFNTTMPWRVGRKAAEQIRTAIDPTRAP